MRLSIFYAILFVHLTIALQAQVSVSDNFNDGDFTSNPSWTGDVASFLVTGSQLQSNGTTAAGSNIHLSLPNTAINNTEWQFLLDMKFAPSSTNYLRIYLVSDNEDLKAATLNGYYIQIGETNQDSLDFYKQTNGVRTKIFTSSKQCFASATANYSNVRIKVTRDNAGSWTFFSDCAGGINFTSDGSVLDNTHTTTTHFGFNPVYATGSRGTLYFFDDVSIGQIITDTAPPTITSVNLISNTQLDVLFNEPLQNSSAQNLSNYSVNTIGNPVSATADGVNPALIHLTFSIPFTSPNTYTLTATNLADIAGNIQPSQSGQFTYAIPGKNDVVINEIFADPSPIVGLPGIEFIEIINTSSSVINLSNWTLSDGGTPAIFPNISLKPDSLLILTSTSGAASYSPFGRTIGLANFPSLNNTGDVLTLKDNTNAEINKVAYSDTWFDDAVKKAGGWTLERINPRNVCGGSSNFEASVNSQGGTPGMANSIFNSIVDNIPPQLISTSFTTLSTIKVTFNETMDSTSLANAQYSLSGGLIIASIEPVLPDYISVNITLSAPAVAGINYTLTVTNASDCNGNLIGSANSTNFSYFIAAENDIVINEIFPDPSPQVGLPELEFVELYNTSQNSIDLAGWTFSDGGTPAVFPSIILKPDSFLLVTSIASLPDFSPFGKTVGLSNFPSLNNDGDPLTLKSSEGIEINKVNYSIAWYKDAIKDDGGWTLERINPSSACAGSSNFKASQDSQGGTPGRENSIFTNIVDNVPPQLISASLVNLTTVKVTFNETMDSTSLANGVYALSDNLTIASIQPVSPDYVSVNLILNSSALDGTTYTLTVSNTADCNGNIITTNNTASFSYFIAAKNDILINEIFPDPSPVIGLPEKEFIELYNASQNPIDLASWTFSDGGTPSVFPSIILKPDSFLIVTSTASLPEFISLGKAIGVSNFPSLNNDGDPLVLTSNNGTEINKVNYSLDWYKDAVKDDGGWSLERINPTIACQGLANWNASVDAKGGTPGKINSVYNLTPDNTAPKILNAQLLSDQNLSLVFDESMDSLSLATASYVISDGLAVNTINPVPTEFNTVGLTFSIPADTGKIYTIAIANAQDCSGNPITLSGNATSFVLPFEGDSSEIILNEILFNPQTGGVDFVEIYNKSERPINLKNWQLANIEKSSTSGNDTISDKVKIKTESLTILPHQYLLLTTDPEIVKNHYPLGKEENFLEMSSFPSLNDDEGTILLLNKDSKIFDRFDYSDDFHLSLLDDKEGVSLERITFDGPSNSSANWHSAATTVGYATPGYENSQHELNNNSNGQISLEPKVFTPNSDGYKDFTLINYRFPNNGNIANITVYDQAGREIKKIARNELLALEGTFQWDGTNEDKTKVRTGYYIIGFELFTMQGERKKFKETVVVSFN